MGKRRAQLSFAGCAQGQTSYDTLVAVASDRLQAILSMPT
jgi:hypothetical protein